jgi:VWFA-related protein
VHLLKFQLAAAAVLSAVLAPGQTGQPFRVTSDLVVLDAQVLDRKTGTAVAGLTGGDFTILEDGIPQRVTHFSQDQIPLSIVLAVDCSTSVLPVLAQIHQGALHALDSLRPEDEVAVIAFGVRTEVIHGFSRDRAAVAAAIGTIDGNVTARVGEQTHIDEALYEATRYLKSRAASGNRRAVIALTDNWTNQPEGQGHSAADARAELLGSGTLVCGLVVGEFPRIARALAEGRRSINSTNPSLQTMYRLLRQKKIKLRNPVGVAAEDTGGVVLEASADGGAYRLRELIRRLRGSYSFGYVSTNKIRDGAFRAIEVRFSPQAGTRGQTAQIVTRKGYYALPAGGSGSP